MAKILHHWKDNCYVFFSSLKISPKKGSCSGSLSIKIFWVSTSNFVKSNLTSALSLSCRSGASQHLRTSKRLLGLAGCSTGWAYEAATWGIQADSSNCHHAGARHGWRWEGAFWLGGRQFGKKCVQNCEPNLRSVGRFPPKIICKTKQKNGSPGKHKLLLISINFTPKNSHSCLKK